MRLSLRILSCLVLSAVVTGCATVAPARKPAAALAAFASEAAGSRIVVYGELRNVLPAFDATAPLERFLYGPNDFGKTVLRNPQGMARLGDQLLICDQGYESLIAVNLTSGQSLLWGDEDHLPRCPVDVAVDDSNRVYVADTTRRSVLVYDANEAFVAELTPGDGKDRTARPVALVLRDGVLFIANAGDRRIDRWDIASQQWLAALKPSVSPGLLAPSGLCFAPTGELLVADAIQSVVHRMAADGTWLAPIGSPGRREGQLIRPKQVSCTPSGLVLVADAGRQSVVVFDLDGTFVSEIRETADGWDGWTLPTGLLSIAGEDFASIISVDGPTPDDWVIVSDPFNDASLTLLGVFAVRTEHRSDAK